MKDKKTLLLDICCANCATVCVQRLRAQGYDVTGFFTNDNINTKEEYIWRRQSAEKISSAMDLKIIYPKYDPDSWREYIKGYEDEPEGGERCKKCFEYRLKETFSFAKEKGYDLFTTPGELIRIGWRIPSGAKDIAIRWS